MLCYFEARDGLRASAVWVGSESLEFGLALNETKEAPTLSGRRFTSSWFPRLKWLPLLDKARTALLAPSDEVKVQMGLAGRIFTELGEPQQTESPGIPSS